MSIVDIVSKAAPSRAEIAPIPGSVPDGLPSPTPYEEIGSTGLLRTKGVGYVYEEWLRDLSAYRSKMVYREMRDNDPVIGAMFFALEMILRKAEWRVEPATPEDVGFTSKHKFAANAKSKRSGGNGTSNKFDQELAEFSAEFVSQCMEDMSHTWEDFVAENVNMFAFGFSLFETVYKRRDGADGKKASRFNDGMIGWRKMAPRAQESILYWIWDDEGGLQGAVQLAAPDYKTVPIPIEQLLLFRTTSVKNNPEGRSILRNCYRPWFLKRRIEEVEGVGIERDLCGLPILYSTADGIKSMGGLENAKRLVRNIRIDDQMGAVLPNAFDEKGNRLVELVLLKTAGGKQSDPDTPIRRYNSDMLNSILAGFIQLGQQPTGSFALHLSASQIFSLAIGAFMDSTAAVMNRVGIPRLMALNKMDLRYAPKLKSGEIGVRDLDELGNYVQKLSMAGISFLDRPTTTYLRKAADLPEESEEDSGANPLPAAEQGKPAGPGTGAEPGRQARPNGAPPKEDQAAGADRLRSAG